MFKAGEKVILKYPEKDTWGVDDDLIYAIKKGYVKIGDPCTVVFYRDDGGFRGNYIRVIFPNGREWNCNHLCFEKPGIKRNLPSWF